MKTANTTIGLLVVAVLATLAAPAQARFSSGSVPARLASGAAPSTPAQPRTPQFVLTNTKVDFGSVAVTETATISAALTNTGAEAGRVDIPQLTAPFGLAHDCPGELAPAASCTLTFTFSPTAAGTASSGTEIAGQIVSLGGFGDMISVASIAASGSHTLAIKTDGTLWAAGYNQFGQLGLGDTSRRTSFVRVASMGAGIAKIVVGGYHTLVKKTDGTLWASGLNSSGQLGLGDTVQRTSFTPVGPLGRDTAEIAAGSNHTLVKKTDGTLWATGDNSGGQLGLGDTVRRTSFTPVPLGTSGANFIAAGNFHTVITKNDGTLWATGANLHGQLGLGDTANRSAFTQVPAMGAATAAIVAGSSNTFVQKTDGTLWATGRNQVGQLGFGDTADRRSFAQVMALGTGVASVATGTHHTLVQKTDGTLWATGYNIVGQLGFGDSASRSSFTQVAAMGTATAAIVAGNNHTFVQKTDGTWWAAGRNDYGQLGLGDTTDRNSFTAVR